MSGEVVLMPVGEETVTTAAKPCVVEQSLLMTEKSDLSVEASKLQPDARATGVSSVNEIENGGGDGIGVGVGRLQRLKAVVPQTPVDHTGDSALCASHSDTGMKRRKQHGMRRSGGDGDRRENFHNGYLVRGPGFRSPNNRYHMDHPPVQSRRATTYPLIYVSPNGTISVLLRYDAIIEMTIDRTIRVLCSGKFSAATNSRGTASCIMHPAARIYQTETKVFSEFANEKLAVFGAKGIIFTMKRLMEAFIVSSANKPRGTLPVPARDVCFPRLESDFTLTLFYENSEYGDPAMPFCEDIVRNASYDIEGNTITIQINGILIKQDASGDVEVSVKPRQIKLSPKLGTCMVRTHFVDMAVQEEEKCHIKRGVKRVHVSKSGMVVSDGNCITAMDHIGRIVSSS